MSNLCPHEWPDPGFPSRTLPRASHSLHWLVFVPQCILVPSLAQVNGIHVHSRLLDVKENSTYQTNGTHLSLVCGLFLLGPLLVNSHHADQEQPTRITISEILWPSHPAITIFPLSKSFRSLFLPISPASNTLINENWLFAYYRTNPDLNMAMYTLQLNSVVSSPFSA